MLLDVRVRLIHQGQLCPQHIVRIREVLETAVDLTELLLHDGVDAFSNPDATIDLLELLLHDGVDTFSSPDATVDIVELFLNAGVRIAVLSELAHDFVALAVSVLYLFLDVIEPHEHPHDRSDTRKTEYRDHGD
jgi:hypothetical protein